MSKRHPDDPAPTWFRLSPESWALVRDEYVAGATARSLAKKYRTSPSSIYRHACREGWTKEKLGDAVARRDAAAAEERERAAAEAADVAAAREAAEIAALVERGTPPAELEQRALASLAAALSKGRASEARALVSVADAMRKRVAVEEAQAAAVVEAVAAEKGARERELIHWFQYVAFLSYCVVHNPKGAPAIFVDLIAEGRKALFDEGDEEALEQAARDATASRRYFKLDEEEWQNALAENNARRKAEWDAADAANG